MNGASTADYPCAMCGGTGQSRLCTAATCCRCSGTGTDPYATRPVTDDDAEGNRS